MASAKVTSNDPAPAAADVVYAPRRSQRVATDLAPSDGDIWQEKLAVCEGASPNGEPRVLIRSYYRNSRSGERVWDEPPSGAGTVLHATSATRKKAETQKLELQLTLEMIPPEEKGDEKEVVIPKNKVKKGFFGRFRKDKAEKQVDTSRDLNLQRAIARSMADHHRKGGRSDDEPVIYYDGESMDQSGKEDDDLALAKALSMSESSSAGLNSNNNINLTEEEMLQRALEESRNLCRQSGATGVASLPDDAVEESSSLTALEQRAGPARHFVGKSDPNED